MRSSTVLALRALVMLGCLVMVPLLALLGSPLSELVRAKWAGPDRDGGGIVSGPPTAPPAGDASRQLELFADLPSASSPLHQERRFVQSDDVPAAAAVRPASPPVDAVTAGYDAPMRRPSADRFTDLQHRLQVLGASYYRLERLGQPGRAYRFYCQMDGDLTIYEAANDDALDAMETVLRQIEARRAATGPRGRLY